MFMYKLFKVLWLVWDESEHREVPRSVFVRAVVAQFSYSHTEEEHWRIHHGVRHEVPRPPQIFQPQGLDPIMLEYSKPRACLS